MKNRSSLILVELLVMLLVFALAAALCLRAFAWAEEQSVKSSQKDEAYRQLQSAAETLKHYRGDFESAADSFGGNWDGRQWIISLEAEQITILAAPQTSETDYLGEAGLQAIDREGQCLAQLTVCWQEVTP